VPRKNLRTLAGRPLIAHAIETAFASTMIDRVIVSTDDDEIAEVARQYGAEVPFMRPKELAQDDSPEWFAWRHAIKALDSLGSGPKMDVLACVPTTSPMRVVEDVDACIRLCLDSDADLVITVKRAQRNPYRDMVVLDEAGYARVVISTDEPISTYVRQAAPIVYDVTTVAYAVRPRFVSESDSMLDGKVRAVVIPGERALDIDTEVDLKFAEFLIAQKPAPGPGQD